MQQFDDKAKRINDSSDANAVSSAPLKSYQQIFDALRADTGFDAMTAGEMLAEFTSWKDSHPTSFELAKHRLEILYPPGRESTKTQEEFLAAVVESRMFCAARFDAVRFAQFDEAFRDLFVQSGAYGSWDVIPRFFTISGKYSVADQAVVDSATTSENFRALSEYYFHMYANPAESFSEFGIKFALDRMPAGEWPKVVEQAVVRAISESRMYQQGAVGYDEMPRRAQKCISDAQGALDSYFQCVLGRSLGLDLREVVYLTPQPTEHADPIAGRIYIDKSNVRDRSDFVRLVIHEAVHLAGKSDDSFGIQDVRYMREALVELLTRDVCEFSAKNGKNLRPKFSPTYLEWAHAVEVLLVDYLFDGEKKPLLDFYNSGDLKSFALTLNGALNRKGERDFPSSLVPRVNHDRLIVGEVEKIRSVVA